MKKAKVTAVLILTLLLAACGITSGTVTAKHYEGPYTYTTMHCTVYIKSNCAAYNPIIHHVDEKWVLSLENKEGKTGEVEVSHSDYDNISVGDVYSKPE